MPTMCWLVLGDKDVGGGNMGAVIGFAIGIIVGISATMIALMVVSDWNEQRQKKEFHKKVTNKSL